MNLDKALNEYKPELVKTYTEMVRKAFARLVEYHGKKLDGVYSGRYWRVHENIRACIVGDETTREKPWSSADKMINEEQLQEEGEKYADTVIKTWKAKIEYKLGEIDNADCKRINSTSFTITGEKFGKSVKIEQQMIVNVSKLGTLFNQFPARIRYDGKAISEKEFQKLCVGGKA